MEKVLRRVKKQGQERKSPVPKPKKIKPRNSGSMTDAAFFQWLRQILRKASMHWKPIAQVRKEAQVAYKGSNKRRKFSYICSVCRGEFSGDKIHVHHIIDCGTLKTFDDLPGFVERLFVEKDGLMVVCDNCHDEIHNKEIK